MAAKTSAATCVVNLVKALVDTHGAELFRDQDGTAYLYAPVFVIQDQIAYYETLPLRSEAARTSLRRLLYNVDGKTVPASALRDAIETLEGGALAGPCRPVYTRLASFDHRIVLDLGTADRRVVVATREGWEITSCPSDVRFVRPSGAGLEALPEPARCDDSLFELVPQILNVERRDTTSMLLLLAWWIVALRGRGPFLVLVIRGGSGTAKSNALLIVRGAIDPNSATKNHPPSSAHDLVIAVANCYVLSMDNVSHLTDEIADAVCVLATGGGMRVRRLFTDAEETIFAKKAPVVINGIPDVLARSDLAARAVVVELQPIGDEQRKTEVEIEAIKRQVMPKMLGRLLDVLVGVLQREHLRPDRLPRMADVAVTLTAAEDSLGLETGRFIGLLQDQQDAAADAVLETSDTLVPVLEALTADESWSGELKEILDKLPPTDAAGRAWTPRKLANALRRTNDVLHRVGLRVVPPTGRERSGRRRGQRLWQIEVLDTEPRRAAEPSAGRTEAIPF